MAQKYYTVEEAAKLLGLTPAEVNQMRERREIFGVNTGVTWKFKSEDIEKLVRDRRAGAKGEGGDDEDVLLSEVELGESDPAKSGTVIGSGKGIKPSDSDIQLAGSDIKLGGSDLDLSGSKSGAANEIDLTLDEDLTLEDSQVSLADEQAIKGGSSIDLGKDEGVVLSGSGSGSDITIGGDSGISLVDPADSGLSLEEPLDLVGSGAGGDESLELGEDDMLTLSDEADNDSPTQLKTDDDFLLTPLEDEGGDADSESGSQVIALDTEGGSDEAATMVARGAGAGMAAMLDEDLSPGAGMGFTPTMSPSLTGGPGMTAPLGAPPSMMADQAALAAAMALPEAPYSVWNILSLSLCAIILVLGGMMAYDLMRNMWSWDGPFNVNSSLMDTVLSWFEG